MLFDLQQCIYVSAVRASFQTEMSYTKSKVRLFTASGRNIKSNVSSCADARLTFRIDVFQDGFTR